MREWPEAGEMLRTKQASKSMDSSYHTSMRRVGITIHGSAGATPIDYYEAQKVVNLGARYKRVI